MGFGEFVDSAGLTFFCNSMVQELYRFRETGKVSKKLTENCEQAIIEFKAFYWPRKEVSFLVDSKFFNNDVNLNTLEKFFKDSKKSFDEKFLDKIIGDLEYILKDNPLDRKLKIASEYQSFFDKLGDYAFYVAKDISMEDYEKAFAVC